MAHWQRMLLVLHLNKHSLNLMCLSMLIAVMRVALLTAYCCDTPPHKQNGLSAKNVDWKRRLCE